MISSSIKSNNVIIDKIKEKNNNVSKTKDKEIKLKEKREKDEIKNSINELQRKWQYLMGQLGKFNKFRKSFGLNSIRCTDYGFAVDIYSPSALSLDELETIKPYIETEFSCEFVYKISYNTNKHKYAEAKFINPEKVKCNSIFFTPYKVKPYEFYAGVDVAGEPIVFDVNVSPQILIAGQTRRGKNGSIYMALVSWFYYCNPSEITFYLFQGAKNDLSQFKDCCQVYCYTNALDEMIVALEHVHQEMKRREKLFEPMVRKAEGNDNIYHYNKLCPQNKLPYIYVVIDEFIALMVDASVDSKEVREKKSIFLNYLQGIVQYGGSMGCNVIILHQKPEKLLMPSFLKNMCNIRICFGFEDETCCQIVLGSGLMKMAHKIPPRKAFYTDNENNGYLYTTDLKGRIKKYIDKSIKIGHRTLFDDLEKLGIKVSKDNNKESSNNPPSNTGKQEISYEQLLKEKEQELKEQKEKLDKQQEDIDRMAGKLKKINEQNHKDTFDKIIPELIKTPELILEENKKKIPNYVEWTPPPQTGKEKI